MREQAGHAMPTWLMVLIAASCGLIVANLYYAQPLLGPISQSLGLRPEAAGLIVTLTQIGYGAGLLLVVPMGDLMESRKLVLSLVALLTAALAMAVFATQAAVFITAALLIGFTAVAVQVLVPYAAHMAPEAQRGRVVGNVVSGLMFGIMLARPVASMIADLWSWHAVYVASAVLMVLLGVVLRVLLPARHPHASMSYGKLLLSMGAILARYGLLRRRALYQAGMFGSFSVFWTATPLLLTSPAYGLTQRGVALFALAGVAGAIAAPLAGRWADRGWTRPASVSCMALAVASYGLTLVAPAGSVLSIGLLVAAAILLDFGVQGNLVLGQRAIYGLGAELRSRVNGLYMAIFFVGGALGSALSAWTFERWGWGATAVLGMAFPVAALVYFATERQPQQTT